MTFIREKWSTPILRSFNGQIWVKWMEAIKRQISDEYKKVLAVNPVQRWERLNKRWRVLINGSFLYLSLNIVYYRFHENQASVGLNELNETSEPLILLIMMTRGTVLNKKTDQKTLKVFSFECESKCEGEV